MWSILLIILVQFLAGLCSTPVNFEEASGCSDAAVDTGPRLESLREQMGRYGYDAYIIPSEDEHLNDVIAPRDRKREWISGFNGSTGTALVTKTDALLWIDANISQAESKLDCNWIIMQTGKAGVLTVEEWIVQHLPAGTVIAGYPLVFRIDSWLCYDNYFKANGNTFKQSIPDLIDEIWVDRPPSLGTQITVYDYEYAGQSWTDKVGEIRAKMREAEAGYLFLTSLEEIAWLYNLRGNDIPYTPVFTSYCLISNDDLILYGNTTLLKDLRSHLTPIFCQSAYICTQRKDLDKARSDLSNFASGGKVWMSSESTTYGMSSVVPNENQIQQESPIKLLKAVKNRKEISAAFRAHVYDGLAVCEYLQWLDENVPQGSVYEISGAEKLKAFRQEQMGNKGLSFETVSAVGANAADMKYEASATSNKALSESEIYLVESGGQYLEGTTAVTRTLHFGNPSALEKEVYTRILMGLLDVEAERLSDSSHANDLDILVQQYFDDVGFENTAHGIGQYLNVHEYPPAIGTSKAADQPLQPGMLMAFGPGYNEEGQFGIRLKNVLVVKRNESEPEERSEAQIFLTTVTLVPYQKKMIDASLLSDRQLRQLNDYHSRILTEVGKEAMVQNKSELYDWLASATTPLTCVKCDAKKIEQSSMSLLFAMVWLSWRLMFPET